MNECASWGECLFKNFAIRVTPNKARIRSLLETSEARIKCNEDRLTEANANFVFEHYYTSVLEVVQSLALLNGFKVNNHICHGYYLRDVLKQSELFRLFDDCRIKRNNLTYYGTRMDFETAKETIKKTEILLKELKKLINQKERNE